MRKVYSYLTLAIMPMLGWFLSETASAHPTQNTTLEVTIQPEGRFHASLNIDLLAYALGETSLQATNEQLQALLDGPRADLGRKLADAGERLRREVVIRTDLGYVTPSSWELPGLPEVNEIIARKIQPPILMPAEIEFSGALPAGAHTLSVRLPYVLGDTLQVFDLPDGDTNAAPVMAGAYSETINLNLQPPEALPKAPALPREAGIGFMRLIPEATGGILFLALLFLINSYVIPFFRNARFRHSR